MWAILKYLDDARFRGEACKMWHLVAYLRSNWKATKPDVEFGIERGWIEQDEEARTYNITTEGREYLQELRTYNETFFSKNLAEFRKRFGRGG